MWNITLLCEQGRAAPTYRGWSATGVAQDTGVPVCTRVSSGLLPLAPEHKSDSALCIGTLGPRRPAAAQCIAALCHRCCDVPFAEAGEPALLTVRTSALLLFPSAFPVVSCRMPPRRRAAGGRIVAIEQENRRNQPRLRAARMTTGTTLQTMWTPILAQAETLRWRRCLQQRLGQRRNLCFEH